jgi:hypothetical protein
MFVYAETPSEDMPMLWMLIPREDLRYAEIPGDADD